MALNDAVPSSATDVFKRNAEDADKLLNASGPVTNRLGNQLLSWEQISQSHAAWNNRGAWTAATAYAVNDIWQDGVNWYVVLSAYTSGASAAADIAGTNVTVLQSKKQVIAINSVSDISGLKGTYDDQQIRLKGWSPDSAMGGGILYWDAAKPKSDHNGASIFSPTVPYSATTANYLNGVGETDAGGSGCWIMLDSSSFTSITVYPIAGEVDFAPRLSSLLDDYDEITCLGTFSILTAIPTITNTTIKGVRGSTVFDMSNSTVVGTPFVLGSEGKIEGVSFVGDTPVDASFVFNASEEYADTVTEMLDKKGQGVLGAITIGTKTSHVKDCEFTFFSDFVVQTVKNNTGSDSHALDCGVSNSRFIYNFGCIDIPGTSEYMKFHNNSMCWNIYGVYKAGGNNTFTGNNIDHNRINFVTRDGHNNSHGSIVGGTVNHAKLCGVLASEITSGEIFSGVNMFDLGDLGIYIRKSRGVNLSGGLLGRVSIYCEGISEEVGYPGVNRISNNLFNLHGVDYKIHRNWNPVTELSDSTMPDNCVFRDNWNMEGDEAKDGSTWNTTVLNDTEVADSDGFIQQQTLATNESPDTNSRTVIGKPIDGRKYLGNGSKSGAIKITLPITGFNTANCSFRINIRTSNRMGGVVEFGAMTLAGGSWANIVVNEDEMPYKIRLGKDATSGKPVIYIGELDTVFISAMVDVEEFAMHAGSFTESHYWKRGWEISQESTAFDNVTQEFLSDFTGAAGDISTIDYNSELYVNPSLSTGAPDAISGWCKTSVRSAGSAIRKQEFTTLGNKLYIRTTQSGDTGYTAWIEK